MPSTPRGFPRAAAVVLSLALAAAAAPAFPPPSFTGVGDLVGGEVYSTATAVSADGQVVVGESSGDAGLLAFRWRGGVMISLGDLPGGLTSSTARAVSADGALIFGRGSLSGMLDAGFVWRQGSMQALLGPSPYSPLSVSRDGAVIVGESGAGYHLAAIRSDASGYTTLPVPAPYTEASAHAVSPDGTVIVGVARPLGSYAVSEAVVWTNGVPALLGDLVGGGVNSFANAVSADGAVIAGGGSRVASGNAEPVVWADGAILRIGDGESAGQARGVSADGKVVVGDLGGHAFVWDSRHGVRDVAALLTDVEGLNLGGWFLTAANAVSGDGLTIVGVGVNPAGYTEGWVARLSPACLADTDGDRGVDINDLLVFLDAYARGAVAADLNGDLGVTVEDLLLFLESYAAGC